MNLKNSIAFLCLFFITCNTYLSAQWTYETGKKLTKDIVINYSVTYENELTNKQKKSSSFIKEIVVIISKKKVVEKKFGYNGISNGSFTLYDYTDEKYYNCRTSKSRKSAFFYEFDEPKIEGTLQEGEGKKIALVPCEKYMTFLKGKPTEVYTTKKIGLRFIKNFNIQGFLMEYTQYDKYLGYYKVKAEKVTFSNVPKNIFSLEGYSIKSYKEYQKEYNEYKKKKEDLLAESIGKKCPKFYARTIKNKKVSSKKLIENGKVFVLNFWFTTCGPCKMEIPKLNELKELYKDESNVEFIAIGLDDKYEIEAFLKKYPLKFDIVDEGRWIANQFDITSYPTNIIIDQKGIVQFFEIGYKRNIKGLMTNKIDELLEN